MRWSYEVRMLHGSQSKLPIFLNCKQAWLGLGTVIEYIVCSHSL
jgi:hypothetical protein